VAPREFVNKSRPLYLLRDGIFYFGGGKRHEL
jgi:hypothetical protein